MLLEKVSTFASVVASNPKTTRVCVPILPSFSGHIDPLKSLLVFGSAARLPRQVPTMRGSARRGGALFASAAVLALSGGLDLVEGFFGKPSSQLVSEQVFFVETSECLGASCRKQFVGANETFGLGAFSDCSKGRSYGHYSSREYHIIPQHLPTLPSPLPGTLWVYVEAHREATLLVCLRRLRGFVCSTDFFLSRRYTTCCSQQSIILSSHDDDCCDFAIQ